MQGKTFCATLKLFCLRTVDQEWNHWLHTDLLPHLAAYVMYNTTYNKFGHKSVLQITEHFCCSNRC